MEKLYINQQAEQLINNYDNFSIINNCLFIHSPKANKQLQDLIQQATLNNRSSLLTRGGGMCYASPSEQASLSILVSPLNLDNVNLDVPDHEVAMVLLNTNEHKISLSSELLMSLYNLSPAEARLALLLCQGLTLDDITEKLSRSKNTLRSQLRSCFSKVGVSRQSDLIHLINTGPAGFIKRK